MSNYTSGNVQVEYLAGTAGGGALGARAAERAGPALRGLRRERRPAARGHEPDGGARRPPQEPGRP